jgi:hypothetical protein
MANRAPEIFASYPEDSKPRRYCIHRWESWTTCEKLPSWGPCLDCVKPTDSHPIPVLIEGKPFQTLPNVVLYCLNFSILGILACL